VSAIDDRYDAFISYNHAADLDVARAVERGLQRLAKPWYKLRALSIFRDMSDTGLNPSLWGTVQRQLDGSRWLILLACPESAASKWVTREVTYWCDTKGVETLLLVLTGGELIWDRASGRFAAGTDALPSDIARRFTSEPLHLDLRRVRHDGDALSLAEPGFRAEMARLASPVRDLPPDEIESEDLRLHRIARRLARGAIAGLVTLALVASIAAVLAVRNANEAERRARQATARQVGLLALDMPASDLDRALLLSAAAAELDHDGGVDRFRPSRTLLGRHARLAAMLHVPRELERPSLLGVAISPAGDFVAATVWSSAPAPTVVRWDLAAGGAPTSQQLSAQSSSRVVLAADGRPITSGRSTIAADPAGRRSFVVESGVVRLVEPAGGDVVAEWSGEQAIAAIAGERAALVTDATVRLIDVESGAVIDERRVDVPPVAVAIRDDTVVTATGAGELTWREVGGTAAESPPEPVVVSSIGRPLRLMIDAGGSRVLAVGERGSAIVDRRAGVLVTDGHSGDTAGDPSGRYAAVGGSSLTVWDLVSAQPLVSVAEEVGAMAWSGCTDGAPCRLVTTGEAIVVWEPGTGRRVELADQTNAQAVDISDDGETIVSAGWGASVALWHMTVAVDDSAREQLTNAGAPVSFDHATGTTARAITDATNGTRIDVAGSETVSVAAGPVDTIRLLAGATRLLVSNDDRLRLFDIVSGAEVALTCEGDSWAVSPGGRRLLTYRSADQAAMVCDAITGSRLVAGRLTGAVVAAVAVDDEGGVALAREGEVVYHAIVDGRFRQGESVDAGFGEERVEIGPIALHRGRIAAAVRARAVRSEPTRVMVWDAIDRGAAVQFETDHREIASVALLGDDAQLLAIAGRPEAQGDVVVQVWESETRRRLGRGLGGLTGDVVALGGDETAVVGTDAAGRTFRWRLDLDPNREVCDVVGRDLTEDEWSSIAGGALARYAYDPVCS
jgi:WD40 repeat protein